MSKCRSTLLIAIWLNIIMLNASEIEIFHRFSIPDSLKTKYLNAKNLKGKIDILNDIAYFFSTRNPGSSVIISQMAVNMADSVKYEYGRYEAMNNLGIAFYRTSRYKQAMASLNAAYSIAENLNMPGKMAGVLSNMALVYNSLGDFENALKYNFNALKIRNSIKDSTGLSFSYNNIGTTYHYKSNFSQALEYYIKALKLKQSLHDKEGMASTYNNIGQLFVEMYSDSLKWPLDSALEYFLKAYYAWNSTSNRSGLSEVLPNIGNVYSLKNLNDRAFDSYMAALNVQKQINDSTGLAFTYFNIGNVYYNQHNLKQAKNNFNKSIVISRQHLVSDLVKDNLKMLFILEGNSGEYKQAYSYASEFVKINDSLNDLSRNRLMEDYLNKTEYQTYETKKLEGVMGKSKTWNIILSVSVLILLVSLISCILKMNKVK